MIKSAETQIKNKHVFISNASQNTRRKDFYKIAPPAIRTPPFHTHTDTHKVQCMLGFSCSPCAPNSNVSQHEAHSPLAVSFSQRAKVTWLAAVSHLTMLKHWRSAALPSPVVGGGGAFSLLLVSNRPSMMKRQCRRAPSRFFRV